MGGDKIDWRQDRHLLVTPDKRNWDRKNPRADRELLGNRLCCWNDRNEGALLTRQTLLEKGLLGTAVWLSSLSRPSTARRLMQRRMPVIICEAECHMASPIDQVARLV